MMGSAEAIIRPLPVVIFLISRFVFGSWDVNWIVFPVTVILLSVIQLYTSCSQGKIAYYNRFTHPRNFI
ncbi:hypothetical protein [Paenibacillus riograndensis]|uniref:Putative membrane protein n=1 Tax=Paenibacillus riograndensis SBR5 TaxID=1073571 RepID=A0A0E4H6M5_9BACL|nr:hypothetical protein [Paenibacillus riograndensis]CQR51724.1 putative membrane protein [Paenibacillus riograndensis SBR5]